MSIIHSKALSHLPSTANMNKRLILIQFVFFKSALIEYIWWFSIDLRINDLCNVGQLSSIQSQDRPEVRFTRVI